VATDLPVQPVVSRPDSEPWDGLTPPYRCIVADPPWRMERAGLTKADSRKFYSTMSVEEIARLPVRALADTSCHLWLWGVNGMMEDAYFVMRAWGFSPITLLTWCKPHR
jgi:N6-adenosine-specific RNA methylase IME4